MEWTKTNIHHAMTKYDQLQDHMFTTFMEWWEDQNGTLRGHDRPGWKEFWDGMHTLNDNSFFRYDCKTKEWVIKKGDEEYRFPENWPYEKLNEEPDLEMLWHSGYWDGPLSGMARYNGKYTWFDCSSREDEDPYFGLRLYKLYQLSDDELKEELYWHEEFRTHVGHHTDYGERYAPCAATEGDMDKFYKPYKKRTERDYTENEVLGEFSEVQFRRARPLTSQ